MKKVLLSGLITLLFFRISLAQTEKNHANNQLIIEFKQDVDFDKKDCVLSKKFNVIELDELNVQKGL